jgi:hypothetical protein
MVAFYYYYVLVPRILPVDPLTVCVCVEGGSVCVCGRVDGGRCVREREEVCVCVCIYMCGGGSDGGRVCVGCVLVMKSKKHSSEIFIRNISVKSQQSAAQHNTAQ